MWDDDYPSCDDCGGGHSTEEHDMSPEEAGISHHQWGTLYHGTPYRIEGEHIDPARFASHAMPGARGTFATTSRALAESYARPNPRTEERARERGLVIEPTVHEVVPHPEHGDYDYEIDPNSGSGGWQDAPHIRDLHELASYGDEGGQGASLMFPGRLISKRQFRVEH